jgi:hypothetical protein
MKNNAFSIRGKLEHEYPKGLPNAELSVAVALEAERMATKYNKDTFDCEDLVSILGVGRNNVRELMRSRHFPTLTIGNRKVVSAIALAKWMMNDSFSQNKD